MEAEPDPVVSLELRTNDLRRARAFLEQLFGWGAERIQVSGRSYFALDVGDRIESGIVERQAERPFWLPYVEVADIGEATERAQALGASVAMWPREGPAGWHGILDVPAAGKVALWQPKR